MPPGGIRTHDSSKRAAEDPRLRQHGHWDRQLIISSQQMHYNVLVFSAPTYVSALPVPSSGVSSRVHNPQCIEFTFTSYNFCKSLSLNITYLLVRSD
jgi:hypothetical protein